ncbi:LVIVD repeat-containing protein [Halostella litorea]|uniref:LVIVD repeat-containing protein n=1 Tax=Halostella litorea TaxID=2528831 RepID=UPI00109244D3|nr:hypothetical protein [Halostella litorea]
MARLPSTVSRRTVLSGLAAAPVVGSIAASDRTAAVGADRAAAPRIEPAATVGLDGVAEAVVGADGETVYCSLADGFGVVDASDPAAPEVLYEERGMEHDGDGPMADVMDVKVSGDRLAVAGPNGGFGNDFSGVFLYDVSDPANPERVAFQPTDHGIHNCSLDGDRLYLTGTGLPNSPVVIYDVSDDNPEKLTEWSAADADDVWADVSSNYAQCHDLYGRGDTLYIAYWDAGTWVVDVSDPANPQFRFRVGGHDPEYLASLGRNPTPEFFELPGNSHYVQPDGDGSALFVGKEAWNRGDSDTVGGPGGIELWDGTEDPSLRTVLAPPQPSPEVDGSGWTSHNFGVDGDRLYTSWYDGGVRVFDVSDLGAPKVLGEWRDPSSTSFWSAKPLAEGFVAGSYQNPSNSREERADGVGATLYLFPEPDGEGATEARTMERREFPEPDQGTTTDPGTTTTAGTTTTTDPPTTTTGGTTTATDGTTAGGGTTPDDGSGDGGGDGDSDSGGQPGFGLLTALLGGGLGLRRYAKRREE